jgi:hypothetical protein
LVAIAAVMLLLPALADESFAQGRGRGAGAAAKPRPTPRWPDGTVNWGAPLGETGLWNVAGGIFAIPDPAPGEKVDPDDAVPGKPLLSQVPFQPWARAIYDYRQENELEPYTRCKPPEGSARSRRRTGRSSFISGPEAVHHLPDWRLAQLPHHLHGWPPASQGREAELLRPQHRPLRRRYAGRGHVGYNERMWISNLEGMPHSDKLHTIERFTRTDMNNMRYELVIDDPGTYTQTWTTAFHVRFTSGVESFEFVCQDGNQAFDLMVGSMERVDRSSQFVP